MLAGQYNVWDGFWRLGRLQMDEGGKPANRGRPGRKPVQGQDLRKFLAILELETIKGLKHAAIQDGTTASEVLEKAAAEWLARRNAGAGKR
ncbi:hypothetical protein [Bradyrhizobium sp. 15]|uniref:hypothetical protein n=1 Tax=Bradyrhizobium sp. 15 TaxID=2782633 RepID=UPI001FFA0494|nr:hypothetical protein [Bradyrhizobium sp. 15]MCK1440764.1 hypothetical protein [Bradyrhizobium sp. 15]